ncbi:glucose/quinate/shikimate family membrane-bound PQQ-dependent dehydrogenase [Microvirga sp. SRT01]|uniref:Glucose/quinate/shikimate family membrane-bound PQQ-dependent dehydrogenase n=1 Tax=Sphingomonas longa TaxID=2778730 RepID=A0ABS2D518_9SPHN|nr:MULTISPECIES: glucose/quinate/shikimate family membrane-bound PQQ-dependent dehydrogenase [Alphaproteobacteria]MBM6576004.1 glucose/quinate/shikimate family membrane-bound PQQ-dependent dehydrogenase [Sphingomonas sp. BT552]MBR7709050.1 glucose/quinate/shikimate family membrane-bound PQQ-dependent dehydrogenase [Microvirga sp. SRT01]
MATRQPAPNDAVDPVHGSRRSKLLSVTAVVVGLFGLATLIGGGLLIAVGGSWYYVIAGLAMLATAWLLWRRNPAALHLFAALVIGTVIWAVAEIGFDWWPLVPRGDIIFLIGAFLLTPWVTRRLDRRWRSAAGPLAGALVVAAIVGIVSLLASSSKEWEGQLPGPRAAMPATENGMPAGDWFAYGGDWRGTKFSRLTQITPANVKDLKVAWSFRTGDVKRAGDPQETTYELTPIKIGDTLYACTPHNIVIALDAETGKQRWRFDPKMTTPLHLQHLTCRGVSYHDARWAGATQAPGGDCPQRIVTATNDARLFALDARTGRPCRSFGVNGAVDLRPNVQNYNGGWFQFTSAPVVTKGLIVVGGAIFDNAAVHMPSGVIRAFDVATGRLVWNFDPGNPNDTAPLGPGRHYVISTPNSWTTSAADEGLGMIYVPMGNGAIDQWGGKRSPETERFSASLVALDIPTGRVRWVYQTVHHDLWDMDIPAQPALVDLTIPGRGIVPAVVQSTKTGNIFVLDRRTGQPVHPVTERPVPGGPAPGDRLSPTQPFSAVTMMPQQRIRESDMWGATMFDQLACRITFRKLRYEGPFTPPSLRGSIVFPGNFGVMDWGGMSIDPVRQVAFAHPNYMAFVDQLIPQGDAGKSNDSGGAAGGSDRGGSDEHGFNPNKGAPFAVSLNPFLSKLGLPCQAPPWGYVAGLDLVSGKVVWRHRNGTIRDESPVPVPIKMGVPTLGGPMMTASGVAFLSSALDYYVRAYDTGTGKVLWRARLPAGAQATPMTYSSPASGRQFIIVVAGGHGSLGTRMGDSIIAYALPRT